MARRWGAALSCQGSSSSEGAHLELKLDGLYRTLAVSKCTQNPLDVLDLLRPEAVAKLHSSRVHNYWIRTIEYENRFASKSPQHISPSKHVLTFPRLRVTW